MADSATQRVLVWYQPIRQCRYHKDSWISGQAVGNGANPDGMLMNVSVTVFFIPFKEGCRGVNHHERNVVTLPD